MKNQYDESDDREFELLRQKVTGLGEKSGRKSYYPELRRRVTDLEKFRALVDRSTDFVMVINPASCAIEDANETVCGHLGYSREELLRLRVCDVVDSLCTAEVNQERTSQAHIRAKNGETTPIEFTISSIELSSGRFSMMIARDMTERNRIEAELYAAKERAESANRAKSEFLANMSHEIRTPLNAILGFTELLAGTSMNEEQQHFAQMISKSGSSLLNLLNDILDLSKIEAGRLKIENAPVNLAELLEETFEIMARGAKAKGLKTRCLIEDSLSQPVLADSYRIRQIVTNLLSNAVKFTADGAVGLTARIESEADGQKQIMFEVADTGVGIPPERLADIFERFTQVDASVTRRFGGTGLGLCITQQLVQLMNGTIDVQSRPGSGSTFRCRFTFEPHAAPPALSAHGAGASVSSATGTPVATGTRSVLPLALPAGSTSSSQDSATRAPLAPLTEPLEAPPAKILIAEDSPDNQMLLKAFLKGQPHTLTFVGDGQSALEAFQSQSFDLVLMDMEMPILDGYSATRAIRAWERSNGKSTTPIIAQTAHALTERVRETLAAGCNLHITKPLSKSKLLEAIASELEKVRAQSVPH